VPRRIHWILPGQQPSLDVTIVDPFEPTRIRERRTDTQGTLADPEHREQNEER
jgi:hypothetical protein